MDSEETGGNRAHRVVSDEPYERGRLCLICVRSYCRVGVWQSVKRGGESLPLTAALEGAVSTYLHILGTFGTPDLTQVNKVFICVGNDVYAFLLIFCYCNLYVVGRLSIELIDNLIVPCSWWIIKRSIAGLKFLALCCLYCCCDRFFLK
jgi:hypothetical protein